MENNKQTLNNSDVVGGVCTEIPRTLKLLGNIPSQVFVKPNHKQTPVYLLGVSESGRQFKNTKQTKPTHSYKELVSLTGIAIKLYSIEYFNVQQQIRNVLA